MKMFFNNTCEVPECETVPPNFNAKWIKNAVPFDDNKPEQCKRWKPLNESAVFTCNPKDFDRTQKIACEKYVYETEDISILHEFDLHCKDKLWMLTSIGSISSFGHLVGLPIAGFVSDRYGRKTLFVGGLTISGLIGLLRTVSPTYFWYAVFEFLEAMCASGIFTCSYTLGIELVGPRKRALSSSIVNAFFTVGELLLVFVVWQVRHWKKTIFIISSLQVSMVICFWISPESIRWLLTKQKYAKANTIIKKIAKVNGTTVSEEDLAKLRNTEERQTMSMKRVITSPIIMLNFIVCTVLWITSVLLFFGLTVKSAAISDNTYLDFALASLAEIPACFTAYVALYMFRRKVTLSIYIVCTSIIWILYLVVNEDSYWAMLTLSVIGKYFSTTTFSVTIIMTTEIFPTPVRQLLTNSCSALSTVGSIAAPQLPLLEQIWKPLPSVLFCSVGILSAVLVFLLPETLNTRLPDTIEEAETLGQKMKSRNGSLYSLHE